MVFEKKTSLSSRLKAGRNKKKRRELIVQTTRICGSAASLW